MKKVAEHIVPAPPFNTGIQGYFALEHSSALPFTKFSGLNIHFAIRVKHPFIEVIQTVPSSSGAYLNKTNLRANSSMIKQHDKVIFSTEYNCISRRTTEDVNYCGFESKNKNIPNHKNIPKTQSNKHLVLTYK